MNPWILATRPKTLAAGICPVVIGGFLAWSDHLFKLWPTLIALICSLLIQIATNFANDYLDFKKGADTPNRMGPTRATQAGLISIQAMKTACIATFAAAGLLGLGLVIRGGWPILIIGFFSILCGYLYTGGPKPLGYLGLGDLLVWVFFGPVATAGTYYLSSLGPLGHSLGFGAALGCFSVGILAVNNLRDEPEDKKTGKKTLAVRFGQNFAKWEYTLVILIGALLPGVLYGKTHPLYWLTSLVLIPAAPLIKAVFTQTGKALNPVLAKTGVLIVVFTLLSLCSLFERPVRLCYEMAKLNHFRLAYLAPLNHASREIAHFDHSLTSLFEKFLDFSTSPVYAESTSTISKAQLIASEKTYIPNTPFQVAVEITLPPGWHTYGKDPGEVGAPPTFEWKLPKGSKISEPHFPPTQPFNALGFKQNGYDKKVKFTFTLTLPNTQEPISVQVKWLICKDTCKPQSASLTLKLSPQLSPTGPPKPSTEAVKELPSPPSGNKGNNTLLILFGAFIGGLILNIMPCVFPVLSLKLLHLAENPPKRVLHALAYTTGVLVSFWSLAGLLFWLKSTGLALGWGFQLQSPLFLLGLTCLFWILTLNLFGLFEIGLTLTQVHTTQTGLKGSFFTGVLSTLVATPCTAPFVGSALGIALTQPGWLSAAIFTAMALGLAFPFLALALSPQVAKALPKPGAWMMHFKQFLGFPMAGTVIWMLWSLSSHIENTTLFMVLGCLVSMGLGAWIYGLGQSKLKWSGLILIGLTLVYAVTLIQPKSKAASLTWVPYSERTLSESRTSGRPVFVDFGAEWCATCKFNELRVLNTPEIQAYFKTHQFILIKADWTQNDPEITAALAQYNRNAVPLYLYFPPGKPAKVLPELLKKQDILLLRPRR